MSALPVLDHRKNRKRSSKQIALHCLRLALFVSILLMIRFTHRQTEFLDHDLAANTMAVELVNGSFSNRVSIGSFDRTLSGNVVTNEPGEKLGFVIQTSPESDHLIGYTGPTNCLIVVDMNNQILSVSILGSGDTVEHVEAVKAAPEFFESFQGLGFETTDQWKTLDGVSGATLTSYAIIASVANRMGDEAPSLKFDRKPDLANVRKLFPDAALLSETDKQNLWKVNSIDETKLGIILSTTPTGDHLTGFQGPTVALAGFDLQEKCIGIVIDQTYENEPYATYLEDDYGFLGLYTGKEMNELATMNPATTGIEGVSGATMTSMSVAEALPLAAQSVLAKSKPVNTSNSSSRTWKSYWADLLTVILTLLGVSFSFSNLSRNKWFRFAYQVAVILFLGLINGHMISQALVVGWSAHAVPWSVAPGLVFLSLAALIVPVFSKHQPYCQHICPFGAIQQLGRNRIGLKVAIPKPVARILECVPWAILCLAVFVAMSHSTFNLASIEPFHAFAFRVAGWSTIAILLAGLAFSLVSPMAYCRFGCPTGAMINFLRFRADSDRLGIRDASAAALVIAAVVCLIRF